MKKTLITALLGIVSVAVTCGQGHVIFSTYVGSVYQPVTYGPNSPFPGQIAGTSVSAQLWYGLGAGVPFALMQPVVGSITAVGTMVPGYITGPNVTIPSYISGPITFGILAWEGPDYHFALYTAPAVTWTEDSINPISNPTDVFQKNVPPITIGWIPEPSTLSLAGLGAAALLFFRRRPYADSAPTAAIFAEEAFGGRRLRTKPRSTNAMKRTLLTVAALAAGIATSLAQSNVYSDNIAGYIQVPIVSAAQTLLAKPLDDGTNTLTSMGSVLPNKTVVQTWNGTGFVPSSKLSGVWTTNLGLPPGTGFFIKPASGTTLTFVGTAPASNNMPLAGGVQALIGGIIPFSGTLTNAGANTLNLGASLPNKSVVQVWTGAGYNPSQKLSGSWTTNLSIGVAQGFFVKPSSAATWSQYLQ